MTATIIFATRLGAADGSLEAAAALAVAAATAGRSVLLVDLDGSRPRGPTVIASTNAREAEATVGRALAGEGFRPAARGQVCHLPLTPDPEGLGAIRASTAALPEPSACVLHLPPTLLRPALERDDLRPKGALLRADLARDRSLAALAVGDLVGAGIRARIARTPLGWLAGRLALAGLPPGGAGEREARRHLAGLIGEGASRRGEAGQALPLALGGVAVLLIAALALVAIAGALTGKARAQRAADLAALSAARSMRDDLPRLLSPPTLPNGLPNPAHLGKRTYLGRARRAGGRASRANGVGPDRLRLSFPDRSSFAPLRARARVLATVRSGGAAARTSASATAGASLPAAVAGPRTMASGGGYGGALIFRQGEGMRPDVAAAFDRMSSAAARAGLSLVVNSGFRSDAEQAKLFAANPDPRWVAPPGHSLHRCATELDLGPPAAYGWLAANAHRFGFVQRYSWEAWHFGYDAGPPPCSAEGDAVLGAGDDGAAAGAAGLPGFVPARFRAPLLRAASRWNVSAALLAAQLMAESNFNPFAVSPAGAQGIAQFIPSTAAVYGLRDPFDPDAAIDAQAHLMSDLLGQFGSPALALAAYNAGPASVAACGCVPGIPETQAYVARTLGLLDGAGAMLAPQLEVRLID